MDRELSMELMSLESEKRMGEAAIKGHQNALSALLNGTMGKDMNDVLSGAKTVKLTLKQKFRYKIYNFFKTITNIEDEHGI